MYWQNSTKDIIKWFHFLTIIEHTTNILNPNKGLIISLIKVFAMFKLRLFDDKEDEEVKVVEIIAIGYHTAVTN